MNQNKTKKRPNKLASILSDKTLLIIMSLGFILRIVYAKVDPFLHEWDERYHALVAKNMMNNPFVPMLHDHPLVPYDFTSWCCNSVWLHKQPLFMWQMALSMKIFGVSEFTMRLPSVILGTLMIYFVYRIAILFTDNISTSIFSSLLMCFSHYQLEQTSGLIGMDHNDIAFSFYTLASIWALVEKQKNNKLKWVILIGLFSGLAILNKWLTGLLVFFPWGLIAIKEIITNKNFKEIKDLALALFICLMTFLPWQIYIFMNFYEIAFHEFEYNSKHIWEIVEEHSGPITYYIGKFPLYFGKIIFLLIPAGFILSFKSDNNFKKQINFILLTSFFVILIFFSVIVKTKLPSYIFIVAPIGMIYMAIAMDYIFINIRNTWIIYAFTLLIIWITLDPIKSIEVRRNNVSRETRIYNTEIYKSLDKDLPGHVKDVINTNSFENIDAMFYNEDLNMYHWWFDTKYLDSLREKNIWIGAYKNHGDYIIPPEFEEYPYLIKIDQTLK